MKTSQSRRVSDFCLQVALGLILLILSNSNLLPSLNKSSVDKSGSLIICFLKVDSAVKFPVQNVFFYALFAAVNGN